MKEMHHRVKNNLQIVVSLLKMQTNYLKDEFTLNAFGEISNRIQAISLIHQRLYRVENTTEIQMRDYINELISYLKESAVDTSTIQFQVNVTDINMEISQSVPVGLMINEMITNSIKYAFVGRTNGLITVSFQQEDQKIILTVADNGVGLPNDFDSNNHSMGMQLIKTLTEQLEGTLTIENKDGVYFCVDGWSSLKELLAGKSGVSPFLPQKLSCPNSAPFSRTRKPSC